MTQTGATRQSPQITNKEFQRWAVNQQGQTKIESITQHFDNLLNQCKQVLPSNSLYLLQASIDLQTACMTVTKGIAAQLENQE